MVSGASSFFGAEKGLTAGASEAVHRSPECMEEAELLTKGDVLGCSPRG